MPRILVLGWLVVALMGRSADGEDVVEKSMVTPCAGVLEKQKDMEEGQRAMEHELKSLRQAMLSLTLNSVPGRGSVQELMELKTKLAVLERKLEAAETTLKDVKSRQETTATTLQATQSLSKRKGASTFVRWGRKTCPSTTQLVYSGVVGGAHYTHPGGAVDALCLTRSPQFDSTPKPSAHTYLYGAEYENIPSHHDHDVPCAVCRTPHSTTIMIPSTHACPAGWTVEYAGHLASGHHGHQAASEYVCLDEDLENSSSGHKNHDGKLFYYIVYQCGSLPCPPYVANKIVLCVVCSK